MQVLEVHFEHELVAEAKASHQPYGCSQVVGLGQQGVEVRLEVGELQTEVQGLIKQKVVYSALLAVEGVPVHFGPQQAEEGGVDDMLVEGLVDAVRGTPLAEEPPEEVHHTLFELQHINS